MKITHFVLALAPAFAWPSLAAADCAQQAAPVAIHAFAVPTTALFTPTTVVSPTTVLSPSSALALAAGTIVTPTAVVPMLVTLTVVVTDVVRHHHAARVQVTRTRTRLR